MGVVLLVICSIMGHSFCYNEPFKGSYVFQKRRPHDPSDPRNLFAAVYKKRSSGWKGRESLYSRSSGWKGRESLYSSKRFQKKKWSSGSIRSKKFISRNLRI